MWLVGLTWVGNVSQVCLKKKQFECVSSDLLVRALGSVSSTFAMTLVFTYLSGAAFFLFLFDKRYAVDEESRDL